MLLAFAFVRYGKGCLVCLLLLKNMEGGSNQFGAVSFVKTQEMSLT